MLDPIAGPEFDPAPLAECLADPDVEIVLHAGRQDVALLRRCWDTDVTNVFDTQIAAGFAGFSAQAGYLGLLHDVLRIRLKKSASLHALGPAAADRRAAHATRPRTSSTCCRSPTRSRRRLREAGRLEWAREECLPIAAATDERDPDQVWRRLPRSSGLDPRERAIARELAAWRERTAEREDRPVGSVLRDPSVVELAKRAPRDRKALGIIRGITPDVAAPPRRRRPRRDRARPRGRADPARARGAPDDGVRRRAGDRAGRVAGAHARARGRARLRADRRARRPHADRRRRPPRRRPAGRAHAARAGAASWSATSCWRCCAASARCSVDSRARRRSVRTDRVRRVSDASAWRGRTPPDRAAGVAGGTARPPTAPA